MILKILVSHPKLSKAVVRKRCQNSDFWVGRIIELDYKASKSGHYRILKKKVLFSCMRLRKVLSSDQNWLLRPFPPLTVGIYDL